MNSTSRAATRVAAALGALGLLGLSLYSSVSVGRDHQLASIDASLDRNAAEKAKAIASYFERARAVNALAAQNTAFRNYGPNDPMAPLNSALLFLQNLYPGTIGEACLINHSGPEIARVVAGEAASPADLSPDESGNPFFKPTFAVADRTVHQAAPYVSPDTGRWVISNSTPISDASGTNQTILHFEVDLDSFRSQLPRATNRDWYSVVDGQGRVIIDSRYPQASDGPLGRPDDKRFMALVGDTRDTGRMRGKGFRASFERIPTTATNTNQWTVVGASADTGSGWSAGINGMTVVTALGALLLLAFVSRSFAQYEANLKDQVMTDDLTGFPNRVRLLDRAGHALAAARRDHKKTAVLLLDLDRFKEVNDTLGHHIGDLLLQQIGPRIQGELRLGDTVARLGGDEFAVLLPDVPSEATAMLIAERIRDAIERPIQVDELTLDVEVSIGVAVAPSHGDDVNLLMQRADVAMYVAKQSMVGASLYDSAIDDHNPRRLALLGELRQAIRERELVLAYQPKGELPTGDLAGVEALVRWQHPTRGLVMPDEFIELAEHTALIQPLTRFVLDEALHQCRRWLDDGRHISVAVNISARSLLDSELITMVTELLSTYDLPAGMLTLELTESAIMNDPNRARATLVELSTMGVRLAIDDFGTGYSSLAYLKTLPVNELKIDRSFVLNMVENPSDAVIVRSVIDLGHNLGLRVVAEGLETDEMARKLQNAGCTHAQGFLWARPASAQAVANYADRGHSVPAGQEIDVARAGLGSH